MKRLLAVAGMLALAAVQPATAADPYNINVILPMTGSSAYIGASMAQALTIYEKQTNETGGIDGRPLHFQIADDQGSPQIAVQLTNDLLSSKPAVILGYGVAALCRAILSLVPDGPVIYCFSPSVLPPKGSYVFVSSMTVRAIDTGFIRFAKQRGYRRIGLLFPTDASGQISDQTISDVLSQPEYRGIKVVDHERFNPSDLSVAAQIANLKAAGPDVVYTSATGTAFGTVLRAIHDGGLDVPIVGTAANMSYEQLAQYASFMPKELLFNGFLYQEAATVRGAARVKIDEFNRAFAAANTRPSPLNALAWDPALLIVSALRKLGPSVTAAQLRGYFVTLHGVAGISGVYDFRTGDQHGLSDASVVVVRWDPKTAAFVAADYK